MTVAGAGQPPWRPRKAELADISAISGLIPLSVRVLQAPYYTEAQREAAIGPFFNVDRQLIRDQTYFVVEYNGEVIGCGGWSKRESMCGGDGADGPELDPRTDPARIRAFFVHPAWARRGVARSLMAASEQAIAQAGFRSIVLMSTLAGEPLYLAMGYRATERSVAGMDGGLALPVVRMEKSLLGPAEAP
jgi:GNAT superfamily N-acetyltransferase